MPHVPRREHAGQAGLERKRWTGWPFLPSSDGEVLAGENETMGIALDARGQPLGVWLGADEDEQGSRRHGPGLARGLVAEHQTLRAHRSRTSDPRDVET